MRKLKDYKKNKNIDQQSFVSNDMYENAEDDVQNDEKNTDDDNQYFDNDDAYEIIKDDIQNDNNTDDDNHSSNSNGVKDDAEDDTKNEKTDDNSLRNVIIAIIIIGIVLAIVAVPFTNDFKASCYGLGFLILSIVYSVYIYKHFSNKFRNKFVNLTLDVFIVSLGCVLFLLICNYIIEKNFLNLSALIKSTLENEIVFVIRGYISLAVFIMLKPTIYAGISSDNCYGKGFTLKTVIGIAFSILCFALLVKYELV